MKSTLISPAMLRRRAKNTVNKTFFNTRNSRMKSPTPMMDKLIANTKNSGVRVPPVGQPKTRNKQNGQHVNPYNNAVVNSLHINPQLRPRPCMVKGKAKSKQGESMKMLSKVSSHFYNL